MHLLWYCINVHISHSSNDICTVAHTRSVTSQLWHKNSRQGRRWLHYHYYYADKGGISEHARRQLIQRFKAHSLEEQQKPSIMRQQLCPEARALWARSRAEGAAAMEAAGRTDWVEDWWVPGGEHGVDETGGVELERGRPEVLGGGGVRLEEDGSMDHGAGNVGLEEQMEGLELEDEAEEDGQKAVEDEEDEERGEENDDSSWGCALALRLVKPS